MRNDSGFVFATYSKLQQLHFINKCNKYIRNTYQNLDSNIPRYATQFSAVPSVSVYIL
jgi:hypothetical protein